MPVFLRFFYFQGRLYAQPSPPSTCRHIWHSPMLRWMTARPFGTESPDQGVKNRPFPARIHSAHWNDRRRALPCDSTTPLHGSQGRRPRPAIHMGGPPFPHTENLRDGSTGSANQCGLPRCRLRGSQLQNRRHDYSCTTQGAGLPHPNPRPLAEQRVYPVHSNCTRVLTTGCEDSRERSRKLIDLSCT